MRFFRLVSQGLVICALGVGLYDLVLEWFVNARFKIRTVEQIWTGYSKTGFEQGARTLQSLFSKGLANAFLHLPAPVASLLMAAIFYLIYRLLALVIGESKSARL